MNRYLIAALYVMAGCAVTLPLKVQVEGASVECCRMQMTQAVRTITVAVEQVKKKQSQSSFYAQHEFVVDLDEELVALAALRSYRIEIGTLCRTSHKIRAPEC